MPAVSLVCPHCEKPVEVQVTGVTRSRPCPECGEMLMLQVAEKNKKSKRRALLMGGAVPETPAESTLQIPSRKAATTPSPAENPATAPLPLKSEAPVSAASPAPLAQDSKAASPSEEPETKPATGSHSRTINFVPSHEPQVLPGDAFERMRMDPEIKEFRKRLIVGSSVVVGCILLVLIIRMLTGGGDAEPQAKASPSGTAMPSLSMEEGPEAAPVPDGNLVFKAPGKQDFAKAVSDSPSAAVTSTQVSMDMALSIEALRKFLAAPNYKERLSWSRPLEGIEEKMHSYYTQHGDGPVPHENIVESRDPDGQFFEHIVVMEGGGRRLAIVEKTPKGPRVDWAAFVGLGDMSWGQFISEKPTQPTQMRVMVSDGFYYENQFGSPKLLKCLELRCVSEPGAAVIHGYLERDSTISQQIEFWLKQSSGAAIPLTLRLKYPVNAPSDKQVWVSEIVRRGWVDG